MSSSTRPSRSAVARIAAAAMLALLTACGDDPATSPAEAAPAGPSSAPPSAHSSPSATPSSAGTFSVASGGAVNGPDRVAVSLGSDVVLTVASDAADEVHVHGYDRTFPVRAGEPTTIRFRADVPGIFELELHEAEVPLTQLRVSP